MDRNGLSRYFSNTVKEAKVAIVCVYNDIVDAVVRHIPAVLLLLDL